MSRRALALAARDVLRSELDLLDEVCELAVDQGRPPPSCGERFIGVWAGSRTGNARPSGGLDETYNLNVAITFRIMGKAPFDRVATRMLYSQEENIMATGMEDFADRVRAVLHKDQYDHSIIRAANQILSSDNFPSTGFCEPLRFMGDDEPALVSSQWFSSNGQKPHGVVMLMRFGGARRLQKYSAPAGEEPT